MRRYKAGVPKEVICPHPECLRTFRPRDMLFRDARGEVHPGRRSRFRPSRLPEPPARARDKICPMCGGLLPQTAGEQMDLIIGLVGARLTGKSHYIASLVRRLREGAGAAFNCSLMALDDGTTRRYKVDFDGPLYANKEELLLTDATAPPLLYELSFAGAPGEKRRVRSVTLLLYDTAGENFESMRDVVNQTPYLRVAAGIIVLVDPLQIETVRQHVGKSAKLPELDDYAAPHEIVDNMAALLRDKDLMTSDGQFATPVAIALAKCDALREVGLISESCAWANEDARHEGEYNLALHRDITGMFAGYMERWSQGAYNTIRIRFEHHAFFGVSATGCSADEDGNYPHISPWRVEDPLMWLLYELGVIGGRDGGF